MKRPGIGLLYPTWCGALARTFAASFKALFAHMYRFVLTLHSWNRWAVLLAFGLALGYAYRGWLGRQPYGPADRHLGAVLTGLLHLQLLLGFTL